MSEDPFDRRIDIESIRLTSEVRFPLDDESAPQVNQTIPTLEQNQLPQKRFSKLNKILIFIFCLCLILSVVQISISFAQSHGQIDGDSPKKIIHHISNKQQGSSQSSQNTSQNKNQVDSSSNQQDSNKSSKFNDQTEKDPIENVKPSKEQPEIPASKETEGKEKVEETINEGKEEEFDIKKVATKTEQQEEDSWWDNVDEERLHWGHYKPHLLYSISEKKNNPMSISMSYQPMMKFNDVIVKFTDSNNNMSVFYNFLRNDGVRFSEFKIYDKRYDVAIHSYLVKSHKKDKQQAWTSIHKIEKGIKSNGDQKRSIIYSFSREIYDNAAANAEGIRYFHLDSELSNASLTINAFYLPSNTIRDFRSNRQFAGSYRISIKKDGVPVLGEELKSMIKDCKLDEKESQNNWDIKGIIKSNLNSQNMVRSKQHQEGTLINFMLVQILVQAENEYDIELSYDNIQNDSDQPNHEIQSQIEKLKENFDKKFLSFVHDKSEKDDELRKSNQITSETVDECSISAISNLFGGMIYKYGELEYTQIEEERESTPKAIYSFSPSRSRFGWSFLWDDGFHNAIASKFQPQLSASVIKSWLDTMNKDGWICREQTRGDEAKGLCSCPNFSKKDNRDGNPPSLILAISYFLREQTDVMKQMIEEGYLTKIEKWYHWYLKNLMVKDNKYTGNEDYSNTQVNSFVFKYWDKSNGSTMSMNSGLDDYPRYDETNRLASPIGHVDLQSWMYHFTELLKDLSSFNNDTKKVEYYSLILKTIKERMIEYFLDSMDYIFKDIVSTKNQIDDSYHTPHFGYPNLLPLAFGIVDKSTKQLDNLLSRIQNEKIIWTKYGLRSISESDPFFRKGNDYWTGPIWVQMNYLVLRGLKLYYFENSEAAKVYKNLRTNLSTSVCTNWKETGFFFENYNKENTGKGSWAYPFTGWTATIALINAESY